VTLPSDVVKFFADLMPAMLRGEREGLLVAADALADQLLAQRKAGIAAGPEDPRTFFPVLLGRLDRVPGSPVLAASPLRPPRPLCPPGWRGLFAFLYAGASNFVHCIACSSSQ